MTETNIQQELPKGWCYRELGQLCRTTSGGTPNRKESKYYNGEIPWLKSGELNNGRVTEYSESITKLGLDNSSAKVFPKGTLLIALYGATVGKLGVLNFDSATNQALCAIFPPEQLRQKYLFWFLIKHKSSLMNLRAGGAQPNISQKVIREIALPIPPLGEQERIIGKVEELFSDLDAGVAALEVVKKEIKRYRQAVLKKAFEGKLTEKWRKENKDKIEPASKLLERIAKEKEKQTKGKKQKKLPPLDTSNLPELPEGWSYASIKDLLSLSRTGMKTGPFGSLLKKYEHTATGVPVLGIENIGEMKFVPGSKIHITEKKATELSTYDIMPGDIVISRSGTVGEICVVPPSVSNARFSTNLMRLSLNESVLPVYFGFQFKGCPLVINQVSELCKGSTRDFLNQRILNAMVFPVPPVLEQKEIICEIERLFSIADQSEKIVEDALKQSQRLRQSILKRAFEGKLVPQDPNEEPAEKLLERIKKEKG